MDRAIAFQKEVNGFISTIKQEDYNAAAFFDDLTEEQQEEMPVVVQWLED